MAKARRTRCRLASRRFRARARPYKFPSSNRIAARSMFAKDCSKRLEKRDWENVICSVCMECPHNAVLLLCSSHDKGCRPYMCGTSFRYSNCLDQYKKASAKLKSSSNQLMNKSELGNLTCPLCRGQVKGWTIVQPAREFLNLKKRTCMQENCVFTGTFKELRQHMKMEHPSAKPREVDPDVEQNWRRLEIEHDRDDVMSTIRSTMPGLMVFGDYVIERNNADGSDSDEGDDLGRIEAGIGRDFVSVFLLLNALGAAPRNQSGRYDSDSNDSTTINRRTSEMNFSGEEEEEDDEERHSTMMQRGRSGRRRRDREANQNTNLPPN